ncbi:restriction endonuclease subunit S [Acidomonas methanolica]|uniref:Restriction modification system DNA specificity subunit n=1 Tax=Acidomonas methanolica NBRC 104435 TaxID=1231351 RepID=A0A023D930_ACIMT|nr:restriction endonuclease subunit S [Acidomonas methanolica]TCS23514.1 type I restriction enzyme S subunit [Acidomonas methanolica]GAJ30316.1 restriction modification system DNA specificity subunit [Acidomonas methanolica NBRC 104435]GBQ52219.1 restriction modification system DNA specificity subunit [Acidomonas methanolica]GEK98179.1 type I restriction-modification protein subunit S [Acidomonas methanolica NBRC 104435]
MTTTVPLGEVVEIRGGGTPSRSVSDYWDGPIPWATVKDFKSTVLEKTQESITTEGVANSATNVVPAGAVIVPTRMAVGKAAINSIDLAINQDLKALIPKECVDRRFLLHFLLSKAAFLEGRAQGATVKGIKLDLLRSLEFPRLGIEEQRLIASVLDKADGIQRKRADFCEAIHAFLKSAYVHIVGHLNPSHGDWAPFTIEALAEQRKGAIRSGPFGSALRHGEFVDEGIAVLGIDNAVQNKFAWAERRFITPSKYQELRRYKVFPGDVIITIMGTTGRSAVVPEDIPEAITTKHLATITCNKELIHPEVLSFAIHSDPLIIRQIKSFNKGAIMDGLNLGTIRRLEISLPPMDEQLRFVAMLRKARAIYAASETPDGSGEDLFQSLSQRAFRGEL